MEPIRFLWLFDPAAETSHFIDMSQNLGMNWIVANPHIYAKPDFLQGVKKSGLSRGLNFPVFFDEPYLNRHPEAYAIDNRGERARSGWLHFACPLNEGFIESQIAALEYLIRIIDPELISLDFIRNFVFWEQVSPGTSLLDINDGCYCPACRRKLAETCGEEVLTLPARTIKERYLPELAAFRVQTVNQVADRFLKAIHLRTPLAMTMIKLVPWLPEDFGGAGTTLLGQYLPDLAGKFDVYSSMSFTPLLQAPAKKITALADFLRQTTRKNPMMTLQVQKIYDEPEVSTRELRRMLDTLLQENLSGFNIFGYGHLRDDPKRARYLADYFGDNL